MDAKYGSHSPEPLERVARTQATEREIPSVGRHLLRDPSCGQVAGHWVATS